MPGTPLNESRPIFKLTAPFLLACVAFLLTPLTASHAASELVLSREFQVSALHKMPGPIRILAYSSNKQITLRRRPSNGRYNCKLLPAKNRHSTRMLTPPISA